MNHEMSKNEIFYISNDTITNFNLRNVIYTDIGNDFGSSEFKNFKIFAINFIEGIHFKPKDIYFNEISKKPEDILISEDISNQLKTLLSLTNIFYCFNNKKEKKVKGQDRCKLYIETLFTEDFQVHGYRVWFLFQTKRPDFIDVEKEFDEVVKKCFSKNLAYQKTHGNKNPQHNASIDAVNEINIKKKKTKYTQISNYNMLTSIITLYLKDDVYLNNINNYSGSLSF